MAESHSPVLRKTIDGLNAYGLRDADTELWVIPAHGARILSLRHLRSGRQWLWSARPRRALSPIAPGTAFEDGPLAGVDECLPTVAPCTDGGHTLADHGEAWTRPWSIAPDGLALGNITTTILLEDLGLRLTRRVALDPCGVGFIYTQTNTTDRPAAALWAMHPLFRIEPRMRLELPPALGPLRVESAMGVPSLEDGDTVPGPEHAGIDLPNLALHPETPGYLKLFATHQDGNRYTLRDPAGVGLTTTYGPTDVLPALGLWLTTGGWHGHHHLAIEPTNAATDRLDRVSAPCRAAIDLEPRAQRTWWVRWEWAEGGNDDAA